jgi:hypothetical protein
LSDGQRTHDLEILVENVAFGLADVAALQGRQDEFDDAVAAAETVAARYESIWGELHHEPEFETYDRHAIRQRVRRLNDLGFAIDEIKMEPAGGRSGGVRLKVAISNRQFHANQLRRLTGLVALEGQAQMLLNDLREYHAWIEHAEGRSLTEDQGAERWLVDVLEPALQAVVPLIGEGRDPIQAYCDILEEKWILSELAGRDVGLESAIDAYIGLGAPAPEDDRGPAITTALDIDWSGGLDAPDAV